MLCLILMCARNKKHLSKNNMIFHISGIEVGGRPAKIAEGVAPLRHGAQAVCKQKILFRNDGETNIVLMTNDIIGHAALAEEGRFNKEFVDAMTEPVTSKTTQCVNQMGLAADSGASAERVDSLVKQLDIHNNRLLKDNPTVRNNLIDLIGQYHDVFVTDQMKVGKTDLVEMNIVLANDPTPVRSAVRRIRPELQQSLKEQLDSWEADGVIVPATSPWASPLVPVAKKDGTTRWAVDYRELNKHTIPDAYPTPNLAAAVESLAGSKIFSSLDAAQAFHNVPIKKESQDLTAFICAYGLFKFCRMPFGLRNAGPVYCRLVSKVMADLGLASVVHYLDDILIHTVGMDEHMEAIAKVLQAHRSAGILLKPSKTLFFQERVDFLGFQVSGEGIRPTEKHIKSIENMKKPTTGKEVASLLGFLQYY